jgi:SRSO17 transposase
VQRQYTGTAGRIKNAQVAVYLTYATADADAFLLIDRALYLPRSWVQDKQRCIVAGVPAGTSFATKPALAQAMIVRALDAGVPACWVAGDEVYGQDPQLRAELEARGVGYVLGVASTHRVRTHAGMLPAVEVAKRLPPSVWQTTGADPAPRATATTRGPWSTWTSRPPVAGC